MAAGCRLGSRCADDRGRYCDRAAAPSDPDAERHQRRRCSTPPFAVVTDEGSPADMLTVGAGASNANGRDRTAAGIRYVAAGRRDWGHHRISLHRRSRGETLLWSESSCGSRGGHGETRSTRTGTHLGYRLLLGQCGGLGQCRGLGQRGGLGEHRRLDQCGRVGQPVSECHRQQRRGLGQSVPYFSR